MKSLGIDLESGRIIQVYQSLCGKVSLLNHSRQPGSWTTQDSLDLYGLDRWGRGFFSINPDGNIWVKAEARDGTPTKFDLKELVKDAESKLNGPPMIVRFPGIIRQRIRQISKAFAESINEFDYQGDYRLIYPIKVNQHAEVVESVLEVGGEFRIGLESGSKAELLTVIARAKKGVRILCNGFKDQEIVEMAFLADLVGHEITIVIEKPSDIDLIVQVSKLYANRPRLGIRTKLGWKGAGHWSSTNGINSKFGLNATELLQGIQKLKKNGLLQQVELLHFHPGSQISDVRLIKSALIEVTRVYADLVTMGVPLNTIDVGGGLAIDYTGNQNRKSASMNYTLQEYANDVVYYIQMVCNQTGVSHPNIYSESGRAVTAHHSILVIPVFATSDRRQNANENDTTEIKQENWDADDPDLQPLSQLQEVLEVVEKQLEAQKKNIDVRVLSEAFHDGQQALEMALQLFLNGHLSLFQRSYAEQVYWRICDQIRSVLYALEFVPDDLRQLRDQLADTYFANFSVFQSLPDFWALDQLFPVIPIHRLNERPDRRGIIGDITCDSDGQINRFLGSQVKHQESLPLHALKDGERYWLGVFLVGAYQEALSDDHNLMGKFNTLIVDAETIVDAEIGDSQVNCQLMPGSDLREVIEHVNHDWDDLLSRFKSLCRSQVLEAKLDEGNMMRALEFFEHMSKRYTYLASREPSAETSRRNSTVDEADLQVKTAEKNPPADSTLAH